MRILSLKQPYAGLMLYGKIETRTWNTKYRGDVIIHASAGKYSKPAIERISGRMVDKFYQSITPGGVFKALGLTNTFGRLIAVGELLNT